MSSFSQQNSLKQRAREKPGNVTGLGSILLIDARCARPKGELIARSLVDLAQ